MTLPRERYSLDCDRFASRRTFVVTRLPRLVELENYPTTGPTGSALMNANDVAGGLELYTSRRATAGIGLADGLACTSRAGLRPDMRYMLRSWRRQPVLSA